MAWDPETHVPKPSYKRTGRPIGRPVKEKRQRAPVNRSTVERTLQQTLDNGVKLVPEDVVRLEMAVEDRYSVDDVLETRLYSKYDPPL
jgi:hypothetical protein